jgi:ABC-type phosphate/phosphonate transport system ATPase subunit
MTLIVRKLPRLFSTFAVQNSSALQSAPCNISSTQVVFVLGAPGAGKSTQSSRLVSEFGYAHFSAGALIRDLIREGGDLSSKLATIVNDGQIIPSHVRIELKLLPPSLCHHSAC